MSNLSKAEREIELARATANAFRTLKRGDKIMVKRCGGLRVRYTFERWEFNGQWAVSKTGVNDIHAIHIYKVNGKLVDFTSGGRL